jgi:quinohemoprotein ethanol dehydrogenase
LRDPAVWQSIVHDGVRSANGMVAFAGQMSKEEIETIRAYVIYRANETKSQAK